MGMFGGVGKFLAAANPVALIANAFSGGLDYLSAEQDRKAAEANSRRDLAFNDAWAHKNFEFQENLAKHGIRWRMEDAAEAGIHPLAAMGMNPAGGAPTQVFSSGGGSSTSSSGNLFRSLSGLGQNLSRAAAAGQTSFEREASALNLRKLRSEIDYIDSMKLETLARTRALGLPAPMPSNEDLQVRPITRIRQDLEDNWDRVWHSATDLGNAYLNHSGTAGAQIINWFRKKR